MNRRSARKVSSFKHVHVSSKKAALSPEQILAIERAQATMGSESFMVIMQPTHVYKRFYMVKKLTLLHMLCTCSMPGPIFFLALCLWSLGSILTFPI